MRGSELDRHDLVTRITDRIDEVGVSHVTRVAIDGPTAAGKTVLADELATAFAARGRPTIRASVDGFHNPRRERYSDDLPTAESYYRLSFDYDALRRELLDPLGPDGRRRYRSAVFDLGEDAPVIVDQLAAPDDAVLLFDGVMLLRPELEHAWDFSVYVDVDKSVGRERCVARDARRLGGESGARRSYEDRYAPGQDLYVQRCRPTDVCDLIVTNDDPLRPTLIQPDR